MWSQTNVKKPEHKRTINDISRWPSRLIKIYHTVKNDSWISCKIKDKI